MLAIAPRGLIPGILVVMDGTRDCTWRHRLFWFSNYVMRLDYIFELASFCDFNHGIIFLSTTLIFAYKYWLCYVVLSLFMRCYEFLHRVWFYNLYGLEMSLASFCAQNWPYFEFFPICQVLLSLSQVNRPAGYLSSLSCATLPKIENKYMDLSKEKCNTWFLNKYGIL